MIQTIKLNKILVITCLLFSICLPAFASGDAEIVDSFKQSADAYMTKVFATYEGNHYNFNCTTYSPNSKGHADPTTWYKTVRDIDRNYAIDIQRTNSLISPYVGTIEVTEIYTFFSEKRTKEEAENTTEIALVSTKNRKISLTYQNDQWIVTAINPLRVDTPKDVFEQIRSTDNFRVNTSHLSTY